MSRLRVGIVGLLQESNTFIDDRTTLDHFRADLLLSGDDIRERMIDAPHEIGGFFAGLETAGIDAIPIFLARAVPYGVIEARAFAELVGRMLDELKEAGPLDGILAAPHGATVAEQAPDADGYWLAEVRRTVGSSIPIVATIDLHANLSALMVTSTDAIIAYGTNPHLDQRATGQKAARLLARTLSGEIRPTQMMVSPPMAIGIQKQNTSESPLADCYAEAAQIAADAASFSMVLGFPYADVPEMGSSAIVVTDASFDEAEYVANRIGDMMLRHRHRFETVYTSVVEAVDAVSESSDVPVVLLDMGDNVGGGSPGRSTVLLRALRDRRSGSSFGCIFDPVSVSAASKAGVGGRLDSLAVGDPVAPFVGDFTVRSLYDGKFSESEPRHGGSLTYDQGPTALLDSIDGFCTIMVTSYRMPPFSLSQLTTFGVDPRRYRAIVAKGVIAPMAAYDPVAAGGFIHVDTPGPTRADMTKLVYRNRRRPMFPFEFLEGA